jgi:hypothetical protein
MLSKGKIKYPRLASTKKNWHSLPKRKRANWWQSGLQLQNKPKRRAGLGSHFQ